MVTRRSGWAGGGTRQWRRLRASVLAARRRPDGTWICARCTRHPLHELRRCTRRPRGCDACVHVHHLDGTRGRPPHHVHPARLAVWCARCNLEVGDPTTGTPPAPPPRPNPMQGVTRR
jgi:hypothetical protein